MEITFYYLGTPDGKYVVVFGNQYDHAEIVGVSQVYSNERRLIIHEKEGAASYALKRRRIVRCITNRDAWYRREEAAMMIEKRDLVVLRGTMKLALDNPVTL